MSTRTKSRAKADARAGARTESAARPEPEVQTEATGQAAGEVHAPSTPEDGPRSAPVLRRMDARLAPMLVLTDRRLTNGRPLEDVVRAAVDGGATTVVLREKDLPWVDRMALADRLRMFVPQLIVASDWTIPADGFHLAAGDAPLPRSMALRAPRPLIGRSCHSAADLAAAAAEGCHYATISPVFTSLSKPGYGPALGVDILIGAPLPVYALGGVDPSAVEACRVAGAAGVAVMGAVMGAADPAATVQELLR
jgi:thiamine-phosphate pyrophosphorylase